MTPSKGQKWQRRGIPGANPNAPKEPKPPQMPRNVLMRPLALPPMRPIKDADEDAYSDEP